MDTQSGDLLPAADTVLRNLLGAAAAPKAAAGNGTDTHAVECYPHFSHGTEIEHSIALACQWFATVLCILSLAFYGWHSYKASMGWEEVYVCIIEGKKCASASC